VKPDDITQAVLARDDVARYLGESAGTDSDARRRLEAYLDELRTTQRYRFYRALQHPLYPILRKVERVAEGLEHVHAALHAGRIVYVSNHKSHLDYLVEPLVLDDHGIRPPLTAAGINLFGGAFGLIHRHVTGAIPIRRNSKDPLYLVTLRAYVAELLKRRDLLFYVEGGRSYTGELKSPKTGLLQAALLADRAELSVVPMAVAYDLVLDLEEVEHRLDTLRLRGLKGTTGTQASFLNLFDGDHEKVRQLERRVCEKLGLPKSFAVTGQTYPRKVDSQILNTLSGIAQSASKAATDLRILQSRKEIEEPFEKEQIGSSAMAYKRNPMRSERICGLARFVSSLETSAAQTASTQWLERTLDDSANRRLTLPQAFLAVDAILILYQNVASGLVVYPKVIAKHLTEELPFMATENIMMEAVRQRGGDRQDLHERIRQHSHAAGRVVKEEGKPNDLLQRLAADEAFAGLDFTATLEPSQYVGRAPQQVDEFIAEVVEPIRQRYADELKKTTAEVRV